MKFNKSSEFMGIEKIKAKQKWQLDLFEQWASHNQWLEFHHNHYDWWMFPINRKSSYGLKWTVYEGDIIRLKEDALYLQNYLRGEELLALSWGWNLFEQDYIINSHANQKWHNWFVRLHKAALSLQLFAFNDEFNSFKKYALHLIKQGKDTNFNGKDLSWLFTTGIDPYSKSK